MAEVLAAFRHSHIGSNINQLAKTANEGKLAAALPPETGLRRHPHDPEHADPAPLASRRPTILRRDYQGQSARGRERPCRAPDECRDNDHVELHEVRGFLSNNLAGAFLEVEAAAAATRCQQPFFSVSLNPPKGHMATVEDFEKAADLIEAKFPGLKGQPRILIFHEKEGRRHAHAIWDRITERGLAVQLSHSREKLKDEPRHVCRHGIEAPAGIRDRQHRDPLNYDLSTWQQAKRMGEDPRDLKAIIQEAWAVSDDRASFERALEQNALDLARGDRRGFVIVDPTGEAMSLTRTTGLKSKDLKARLVTPSGCRPCIRRGACCTTR